MGLMRCNSGFAWHKFGYTQPAPFFGHVGWILYAQCHFVLPQSRRHTARVRGRGDEVPAGAHWAGALARALPAVHADHQPAQDAGALGGLQGADGACVLARDGNRSSGLQGARRL